VKDRFGTERAHMPALCSLDIHLVRAGIQIATTHLETGFAENNSEFVILGY
jgi:hypothetical protein